MKYFLTFLAETYTTPTAIPKIKADQATLGNILGIVYAIAAAVAVIVIVIAGIQYSLSGGDASKTKKAKDAILYALVGLVVVLMAFVITQYVIGVV